MAVQGHWERLFTSAATDPLSQSCQVLTMESCSAIAVKEFQVVAIYSGNWDVLSFLLQDLQGGSRMTIYMSVVIKDSSLFQKTVL